MSGIGNLLGVAGAGLSTGGSIAGNPILAGVGAGLSALSGFIGNGEDVKTQYKYWKYGYERQRKGNMEDWITQTDYVNAYNTPQATMARLMAAGLNPNLAYQNGQAWHAAQSPQTVSGGGPVLPAISNRAAIMQAVQQGLLTESQTRLNNAKALEAEKNARKLEGEEDRNDAMFPLIDQYQRNANALIREQYINQSKVNDWYDKLTTEQHRLLENQADHVWEMIQTAQADRNLSQSYLDLERQKFNDNLRLSWAAFDETVRLNSSTIALNASAATRNYSEANLNNTRSLLTGEQYKQLYQQGLIDYDPKYGYLFPVPDGVTLEEFKYALPENMRNFAVTINGRSYVQLSNQLASQFTDAQIDAIQQEIEKGVLSKIKYENKHKSSSRIHRIISGYFPLASGASDVSNAATNARRVRSNPAGRLLK